MPTAAVPRKPAPEAAAGPDELFRRHRPAAYRAALRRLGNAADADDAVQDGCARALARLGGFAGRCGFGTWLVRVVGRAAADAGRRDRRYRRRVCPCDRPPDPADPTPPPDDRAAAADLRRRLAAALARLPAGQRRAFELFAVDGRTYREVAAELGVPVGTVMSRLSAARRKLRAELADLVDP